MTGERSVSVTVGVALAVVLSVLAASAPPVTAANTSMAASDQLVVGSERSSGSELSQATLTNASVDGSGESAFVTLDRTAVFNNSFEGDLSEFTAVNGSGQATWETQNGNAWGNATEIGWSALIHNTSVEEYRVETTLSHESSEGEQSGLITNWQDQNNHIRIKLVEANDQLDIRQVVDGAGQVTSSSYNFQDGTDYRVVATSDGETITVDVYEPSGDLAVSVSTTIKQSLRGSGQVGLNVETGSGGASKWQYLDVSELSTGIYISEHSVSNAEQAAVNLTLTNATADVVVEEYDGSSWTTVNSTTWLSSGNHTLDISAASYSSLRTRVTLSAESGPTTARLHDESILFTNHKPNATNFSPADGAQLTESSVDFSVDVNDSEFGSAQGENVTAELFIDNASVGSKTVSSNQTVTISESLTTGGDHTYHWELRDDYGAATTTATKTVTAPANIDIRNVTVNSTDQHALIKGTNITAEVVIAGSDQTVAQRTVTDGTISLSGLDVTESYSVTVQADGYYLRSIYLNDIYDQSTIFMLNSTRASNANEFELIDNTGQYSDQPKLIIERIINQSRVPGSSESGDQWTVVAGDRLGADSTLQAELEDNTRYRLLVKNKEGDIRALGEYTSKTDERVALTIGTIRWPTSDNTTYSVDAWVLNESGTEYVRFAYTDPDNDTSSLSLSIHAQGNTSQELYSASVDGPLGNYTEVVEIPENSSNVTWVANYTAQRNDNSYQGVIPVGGVEELPLPIEEKWLTPIVYLVLVGVLSATPKASARSGALLVSGLGVMVWWFGWAPLSGPAVGVAGALALVGKAGDYTERM